jgi:hypothetical protein
MLERLQGIISDLKKKDTAHTKAYFITEALRGYGHSPLLGGQDCADYLHGMGLDEETIIKMQRKFLSNPHDMRESLEQSILKSI